MTGFTNVIVWFFKIFQGQGKFEPLALAEQEEPQQEAQIALQSFHLPRPIIRVDQANVQLGVQISGGSSSCANAGVQSSGLCSESQCQVQTLLMGVLASVIGWPSRLYWIIYRKILSYIKL